MRKPNVAQIAGVAFLLLLLTLTSADLFSAVGADACSAGVRPNCYPWGSEGPVAGGWSYESKGNYLIRGFAQVAVLIGLGVSLIARASADRSLSHIEKLCAGGAALFWLLLWLV